MWEKLQSSWTKPEIKPTINSYKSLMLIHIYIYTQNNVGSTDSSEVNDKNGEKYLDPKKQNMKKDRNRVLQKNMN